MRQEGTLEEITRDAILIGTCSAMHLPQIGDKLGEQVATRGDIGLGCDHFPPWAQARRWPALDGSNGDFACLIAHLFIETDTQQFLLLSFNLARLLSSGDGGQESLDAIQC